MFGSGQSLVVLFLTAFLTTTHLFTIGRPAAQSPFTRQVNFPTIALAAGSAGVFFRVSIAVLSFSNSLRKTVSDLVLLAMPASTPALRAERSAAFRIRVAVSKS